MLQSSRIRNWAWLLTIPVAIAIGLAAPGTTRKRFLHILLTLALFVAGVGTMVLIDAIRAKRPQGEIGLAVAFVVFGLAGAFNMIHELTNEFVPAMWLLPVILVVVVIGIRFVYPKGITTQRNHPN